MKDNLIVISTLLVTSMVLSMAVAPSMAFVYPDGSQDNLFEIYGPHIDQILIKKYAGLDPEMQALQNGEIDITDWALDATWTATFNADPNVRVAGYGGEAGYYTFNFNNNNTYLGNPEDPLYPNPVYPNPCSVVSFRQALSHLIDREALCAQEGEGLYDPIFTPIPAYMEPWIHPGITYLSTLAYPPSISDAASLLTAGGFLMGGPGGKARAQQPDQDLQQRPRPRLVLPFLRSVPILSLRPLARLGSYLLQSMFSLFLSLFRI